MATFFTKSEARAAARAGIVAKSAGSAKTSAQILRESRATARDAETIDIFLSHSITDADLVLGVKNLLESRGLKVYVDWDTDRQVDRCNGQSRDGGPIAKENEAKCIASVLGNGRSLRVEMDALGVGLFGCPP